MRLSPGLSSRTRTALSRALVDEFIHDCDTILTAIPGIVAFACGRHIDSGRANVNDDYHVAIYMGFMILDDYRAYLEHANHQALIAKWRPHIIARQTYDMLDETGPNPLLPAGRHPNGSAS